MVKPWMQEQLISDRSFRIVDFAVDSDVIANKTFEDCTIYGPAIIVPLDHVDMVNNSFEADPDALLWEIPEDRVRLVGGIGLISCTFRRCVFRRIGVAGKRDLIEMFTRATSETRPTAETTS